MITIKYYSDPGHGWGVVRRPLLHTLGIAGLISHYSYARGDQVYLEEDCDLEWLCKALRGRGIPYRVVEHTQASRSSRIRSYPRYQARLEAQARLPI